MTLVVGIIAKDGIVIASDSRMTSEINCNDTVQKIIKLNDYNAIGISGDGQLGIHIINTVSNKLDFSKGIIGLVEHIWELTKDCFNKYYAHIQYPKDRPPLTLLIAGYTKTDIPQPQIYQLDSRDNFIPRPSTTGFNCISIPYFADYLLNRFYQSEINIKQAEVLASFCIMETSSQANGVGGNIKIASFSFEQKYSELKLQDINLIQDRCKTFHILNKSKFYPEDIPEDIMNIQKDEIKNKETAQANQN